MRLKESETDFMSWVLDYAKLKRWKVAHFRGAWSKDGKRFVTPVQADGKGFLDLVLARKGTVYFFELKSENGQVSPEQQKWLDEINGDFPLCKIAFVWKPHDRDRIMEILK